MQVEGDNRHESQEPDHHEQGDTVPVGATPRRPLLRLFQDRRGSILPMPSGRRGRLARQNGPAHAHGAPPDVGAA
ncbi:MAG: hypothetical protein OZSIB_3678 [Candidatus Ozemobacter sibiricus]|uniref:Uncharacterized protein n=1 Tax=Candidatus Ozemobacter sibiricus TaxID=2268124 RepID=A0A367ZPV2_9BACT|nr:MAG: hypothetical protein OZSIB_3678 [Candidatus Ozemobacter sibiricus]